MTFTEGLIEIINLLAEKIGVVIDWTNVNVVPYLSNLLERFITFEITKSLAIALTILLITVVSIIVFFMKLHKIRFKENDCDDVDNIIFCVSFVASLIMIIVSFVVIPVEVGDIIELKYLPEKAIIEELYEIKEKL